MDIYCHKWIENNLMDITIPVLQLFQRRSSMWRKSTHPHILVIITKIEIREYTNFVSKLWKADNKNASRNALECFTYFWTYANVIEARDARERRNESLHTVTAYFVSYFNFQISLSLSSFQKHRLECLEIAYTSITRKHTMIAKKQDKHC